MKQKLLNALTAAILFLMPNVNYGQRPTLGAAANFVLFTTNGAMTCSGTKYLTHLTGDVGSNLAGSVTGFGNVDGVMHQFDVATGLCTPDVINLYTELSTAIPTGPLASPFGLGNTLGAGVYKAVGAATLTSDLILDAAGDPNAVFIFQIGGVLSTNPLSKIKLINGALACNVFWQVGGAVNVATGTTLRGTIVANGQIDMTSTLDTLEGRALALNAAILVSQLVAYTPIGCGSPLLTGPPAPALASTGAYGVFSSIGAVTSTPVTYVIGDVGANSTTPTGFNPLNVTGTIHAMDPSTAAAAGDLTNVYNYLVAMPADILLLDPPDFGHGLVLTPHSYQVTGITQLTGNLYLNAEGDANAVFVIKINGSFTTSTFSKIILLNGAQAKNVYWKIDGAVDIYSNSVFNGTMVVAGAISLETNDTLNGRALTINGAIAINGSYVDITPSACSAPLISGTKNVCAGGTTVLSDSTTGGRWISSDTAVATIDSVSGMVTGLTPGNTDIQYTTPAGCIATDTFRVNSGSSVITGPSNVCTGGSITLTGTPTGGVWSSNNTTQATVGSGSGIVTGVSSGSPLISYNLSGGCTATKYITVGPGMGVITGPTTVCIGSSITLSDATAGGIWSSSNTSQATVGSGSGIVTGVTGGQATIIYTVTNACGTSSKAVNIKVGPDAGIISGPAFVCVGSAISLSETASGGGWSSSNAHARVLFGYVTGVSTGIDTIIYTVTNICGTATAIHTVTVNGLPNAGSITGAASVCVGSAITLSDNVPGGVWGSSNATASVSPTGVVTGVTAGIDTIIYRVTNGCGTTAATTTITINPLPYAGTITGAASVCVNATITLTDIAVGGVWSSSNATATVGSTGVVTGVTAGTDTIIYTVTNVCGTIPATKVITVNPLPDAGNITGASSVCVNATITLADVATGGVWSSSNATATVSGGNVSGVTAGVDTIMYSVTNVCGTDIAKKIITVNPLPNAGTITGAASVCVNATITLTDIAVGGVWSSSNATATVGSTGVVTGVTAGTDTIIYTVTNVCGTIPATKVITVNPLPDAGNITGASSVCVNATITLADVATGGVWSSSNATATVSGGNVSGVTAGVDTIMYSVTNVCGTATATKIITVNPLPNAGSITGSASGVCVGSTITLTDVVTGGVWSSSNAIATVTGGVVTGVTAGTSTIIYTVTNMCGIATATKTITVNQLPAAPVIALTSPNSVCDSVFFQNFGAATLPPSGVKYIWSAVNAKISATGSTGQYALVNFKNPGNAAITLTSTVMNTGCSINGTSFTVNVGTQKADVPPQVVYFTKSFVCLQNNEEAYQWGYDDAATLAPSIIQGEMNQDYLINNPDVTNKNYWVKITHNGCIQKAYYNKPSGAALKTSITEVKVYPNPAKDVISVEINTTDPGNMQVEVLNMLGQKLYTATVTDNSAQLDVSQYPNGIYLVICYRDGVKISSARFIKN